MKMWNFDVSLPDEMKRYVEEKVAFGGYGTVSEYIRELIAADERAEMNRLDALIAEAYASGDPVPLTKADIAKAREETHRRIAARQKNKML